MALAHSLSFLSCLVFTSSNIYPTFELWVRLFWMRKNCRWVLIWTVIRFLVFPLVHNSEQCALAPPFCKDQRTQRGSWWPHPRGACCFACEVRSWGAGVFFDLITVLRSAQCALGGDGNYNARAGLLSCPCGDVFPGASQGDGGGALEPWKGTKIPPQTRRAHRPALRANDEPDQRGVPHFVRAFLWAE